MPKVFYTIIFNTIICRIKNDIVILYVIAALYLLYAKLEEEHGLARHAMSVYERATDAVLPEERFEV